jgi:uncharacterized protein (TIGR02996 family)
MHELFPGCGGMAEATWFSGEITPDDVVFLGDGREIQFRTMNNIPLQFLWFTLVVHRGKLLLEEAVDLQSGVVESRLTGHVDGLFPEREVSFLHEVHADVDDPDPKLVYADWLEDQGDPRSALLRSESDRGKSANKRRKRIEWNCKSGRQDIPHGYVDPDNMTWFWRHLAGIPELTPEDARFQQRLSELGG